MGLIHMDSTLQRFWTPHSKVPRRLHAVCREGLLLPRRPKRWALNRKNMSICQWFYQDKSAQKWWNKRP